MQPFISAGHGGLTSSGVVTDPGVVVDGTTEAREMMATRDLILQALRQRGIAGQSVPDALDEEGTINWINGRAVTGNVAIEIHMDASPNSGTRGVTAYYISNNPDRRDDAEFMVRDLVRYVPELAQVNQSIRPDSESGTGKLAFCQQVIVPSLLITLGYLTNPADRQLLQRKRAQFAAGIAFGLSNWLIRERDRLNPNQTYPSIRVVYNGVSSPEGGIIINGNSFVPVNLAERMGLSAVQIQQLYRVRYRNQTYIRAIDLREFNIRVSWRNSDRTLLLLPMPIVPQPIDRIMSRGVGSGLQLAQFVRNINPTGWERFSDLAELYLREANIEGVSHDIAFCQMCLETNFLRFGSSLQPSQNNFCGLAGLAPNSQAQFLDARTGVRACVQHLKAYASTDPLMQAIVDPNFSLVTRGIAPTVPDLSGRWVADPQYGERLLAVLRQFYEANF